MPDELMFLKNRKLPQKTTHELIEGKTCIITGATSGIGFETLKKLAEGKGNIVVVCRDSNKAEHIKEYILKEYGVNIDIFIADFTVLDEVKRVAYNISRKYKVIDILINNAGVYSTTKEFTVDDLEKVFCVNHLASFIFTNILLNNIKKSNQGRIIYVNSEAHRFNGLNLKDLNWKKRIYSGIRAYGASKLAQLLTIIEFDERLKGSNVTINAMHPGDVKTNIGNNNGTLYKMFSKYIICNFLKDSSVSGESIYYLVASKEVEKVSGKFFHLTLEEKPTKQALDKEKSKIIWKQSFELSGLKEENFYV